MIINIYEKQNNTSYEFLEHIHTFLSLKMHAYFILFKCIKFRALIITVYGKRILLYMSVQLN